MRIFQPIFKLSIVFFVIIPGFSDALEFEFVNEGAIPLSNYEMAAIKRAGFMWGDKFSDPMTIKVNVDWQKPGFFSSKTILASVQIGRTTAPMVMVRDALLAEAAVGESGLLASLPVPVPVSHTGLLMDDVSLTLANAKALGITPANDPHFGEVLSNNADAHISFNLDYFGHFFFNQSAIVGDKFDFTGIAAHELGHALGFTSIVDVQSMNPGVLLNPMLLDVFRFPGTVSSPSLTYDTRQTTPGHAQFYDQIFMYALGSGLDYFDPTHCGLPGHRCSASHWEDASTNIMTSASVGNLISVEPDDVHAIDRVGVDTVWRNGIPLINVKAEFYDIGVPLPGYDKVKFATKTDALPFSSVIPNFPEPPTHAFHISFDGHAGTGFAVFVPESRNSEIPAIDFRPLKEEYELRKQWEDNAAVEHMRYIPAHFSHFYFSSKNSAYHFNFINTFSNYGAIFDPSLGEYGGFRLSGFLDGELDGNFYSSHKGRDEKDRPKDYDATITMLLLLQKPYKTSAGITNIPFAIEGEVGRPVQDNILHIIDHTAFGLPPAYNNSSSYLEAWKNRVEQLDGDPEPGRDVAL